MCVIMPTFPLWARKVYNPSGSPGRPRRAASELPHRRERRLEVDSPNPRPRCLWALSEALALPLWLALPGLHAKTQVLPGHRKECGMWAQT